MAPLIKFTYFDVQALGEPVRLLLKYGGIEFEDVRVDFESWKQLKSQMPFGQMPIYEEDGKVVNQSIAIARYIAKKVKLAGDNDWESLEIDATVDNINDLRQKIALYHYEKDEAIKESRKEPLFNETIPYYMERLDKIAKENNGYLVHKKLTWADIYLFGISVYINGMVGGELFTKYPNLQAVLKNVTEEPALKVYIETRPKSDV